MGEPKTEMSGVFRVLLGGKKYPPKRCCCFSLKVGTAIVGQLNWVILVGVKYIIPDPMSVYGYNDEMFPSVFLTESCILGGLVFIFKIIFFLAAQSMMIGNIEDNKKLLEPFVKIKLMEFAGFTTIYTILLPLAYLSEDQYAAAAITFGISIVTVGLSLCFLRVVQYRILEIETQERLTHHDVEAPIYDTDDDNLVYCPKAFLAVHFINDTAVLPPDVGLQMRRSSTM